MLDIDVAQRLWRDKFPIWARWLTSSTGELAGDPPDVVPVRLRRCGSQVEDER